MTRFHYLESIIPISVHKLLPVLFYTVRSVVRKKRDSCVGLEIKCDTALYELPESRRDTLNEDSLTIIYILGLTGFRISNI